MTDAEKQCLRDADLEWSDAGRQFTVIGSAAVIVLLTVACVVLAYIVAVR